MSTIQTELRQSYIDKLQFRDSISTAIENSRRRSQLQTNLINWASPDLVRDNKGGITRKYSDKFLAYCSDERFKRFTEGKTPIQISVEKINACNVILEHEANNRKLLGSDLALVEAELKSLCSQLPPTEQIMSLDELIAIQNGGESPRYDDTTPAKLAAAEATNADASEALDHAIDTALAK